MAYEVMWMTVGSAASGNSDAFTGAATTPLATHDANWGDAYGQAVSGLELNGSGQARSTGGYTERAARYTTSTSDISQVVVVGTSSTGNSRGAMVRAGATGNAYCGLLEGNSTGNYGLAKIMVRGSAERSGVSQDISALALSRSTNKTVRLVAVTNGSQVDLSMYVLEYSSGTPVATWSDTDASRIASGNPGFSMPWVEEVDTALMDDWQDY